MSNHEPIISEATATGEEIFEIVTRIEPALMGVSRGNAVIATLSIAVTLMNPDISPEQLGAAVSGASRWICLFLSGEERNELPKEMLN